MAPMNARLLRPKAASGFDPRTIANLTVWYDASVSTSVTIETGVSQWNDLSGNGRHLTQAVTNNQPAYVTNALNGRPAIDFDGSNDSLSASFTLSQPTRVFCVGNYRLNQANQQLWDGAAAGNRMRKYLNAAGSPGIFAGGAQFVFNQSILGFFVWEAVFNGNNSSLQQNGTTLLSGGAGANVPGGVRLAIFGDGTGNPTNCQIAEFILYNRVITASEASAVRTYLGRKYAITVT
jgi:hypothetical protein